jgi:xylose isomerase
VDKAAHSIQKGASIVNTVKNSVGVWAFGPAVTRFVPPCYHPEVANEDMVEKTERVCEGLHDLLDGLEYH